MKRWKSLSFNNIYVLSIIKKVNVAFFGILATIFINRLLGPELKGKYEYINNILTLLITSLNIGISIVLPNYVRKKNSWTFSTFYALSYCQFALYLFISIILCLIMNSKEWLLYGLVVAFGVLSLQILNCTMIYNFKVTTIANCSGVIINALILGFAFVFEFANITLIFISLIIKELFCIVLCTLPMIRFFHISQVKVCEWKGILISGIIPMITSLLSIMNYKFDILELRWLGITNYQIGIYSVGINLAEYVLLLSDVFKDVLFNKTSQKDDIGSIKFCLRICSTIMISVFAIMILGGKFIIGILYGYSYLSAYKVTVIVVIGVYSMMYFKLLGVLYVAQGKWWFYFLVLLSSVLINIVTNLILIPIWSIYGAAITSVLSYLFAGGIFVNRFMRKYNISIREILFVTEKDLKMITNTFRRSIKKYDK